MSAQAKTSQLSRLKAENRRLKAEVAKLKQSPPDHNQKMSKSLGLLRTIAVVLLVSISVAVITTGNLLFWVGNTIVKQDRFVAATAPLVKDPSVQDAVALYVTNNIFSNVDVQANIEQVLPERADFLAPQLTGQLKGFTQTSLNKILDRSQFQERWNQAMAKQHDRLISFASKYQGDGDISLNDIFNQLTASLSDTKLAFLAGKQLPAKVGDINIISAPYLPLFHNLVVNIDTWRTVALLVFISAAAAAVWLSRNRRRVLYVVSFGGAVTMAATLVSLHYVRDQIIAKADPQYAAGVRQAIYIIFHSLVVQTVTIMATLLLVALIAWISGPSRRAGQIKRQVNLLLSGRLHQHLFAADSSLGIWLQNNKRLLQWAWVAILTIIVLLIRLTPTVLIVYTLGLLAGVLLIETLAGQPPRRGKSRR